ncbi:MAG TPA: hypothetical protein DCP26_05855 [Brevundimonas sp.]|nr:hypothetical protein [Brevundimonas sp.]
MYDEWRIGFIRRPIDHVLKPEGVQADAVTWLPPCPRRFQFLADPFGIERDGVLTVFAEAFDYRIRRGEIRYFQYEGDRLVRQGLALAAPFHLSYPSLIEDDGALYMLPEGYKSGALTLYRCERFPDRWTPVHRLLDLPAIDATVVRRDGRWWMFYALPGPNDRAMREMHVAWADALTGPWTPHAANPVRAGFMDARPGGSAFEHDGALYLPVQECRPTYGAALRLLRVDVLSPTDFLATEVRRFAPDGLLPGFEDGLHTLSGDAEVTFIDVKGLRRSRAEKGIKALYKARRLLGLNGPRDVTAPEQELV